ncbi:FixH family protein [Variovorax sp. J22R133]|uniref:FixH family protein n=1 Tax=Variovorax brevis TaxID=3053503 RepID=UPI0025775E4C|nr:FixH family protein [Variovorax sp. J22R133]MDM0117705.1 FixH family protein [Variovorax sp. J22R133]
MTKQPDNAPWWKFPLVWLVIGLPAVVVVAGLATAWLAVNTTDSVVDADYYRKGVEINRSLDAKALIPAMAGRNHAMTPGKDLPAPATAPAKAAP